MKKLCKVLAVAVALLTVGCTQQVPIGYIGMVQKPSGLTGEVLAPGRHECWGRSKMILVEISENVRSEKLQILCADDLNFGFDLQIRTQINSTNGATVKTLLNNKGSAVVSKGQGTYVLPFNALYETYVKPQAVSKARTIVSEYQTTEIRNNRRVIEKKIKEEIVKALSGTPMSVNMIATSNFDYPTVITAAMEKKRRREIEIEEEKAKQAVELLKATNRLKIAQKMKVTRAAEAEAEAIYMKIVGKSLNQNYLKLRDIEARKVMYTNVGAGDKVIVSGNGAIPMVNTTN